MPEIKKDIFNIEFNSDLVHQVTVSQSSNRRQNTAHTKDRSEKRGGGAKPWRQKGTGRARHGSRRSPIWAGGGVTFGPRNERNYKKGVPIKMRRKALLMILTQKKKDKTLILDDLNIKSAKTKEVVDIIKKLKLKGSITFVLDKNDKDFVLAQRNIQKTRTVVATDLNALDILQYKYVVMRKEAISVIEKTFLK